MLRPEFLTLLRCPITASKLSLAEESLVERLNQAIEAAVLVNRLGETVTDRLDAALLNEAGKLVYAVRDEIVQLLADEALPVDQLADSTTDLP